MPEAAVGGGQRLAAVAQLIFLMRQPYRAVQLKGWQRLVCSRTVGFRSKNKKNRLGGGPHQINNRIVALHYFCIIFTISF